ncbi:MAG TPA: hypothetical protein VK636_05535, partial [Gemmatimonadaceae bacterium]|nr:hypothetical protein [Gemmatimonadaceae bacterium]
MRFTRAGLGVAALVSLSACDVPTSLPSYATLWNVPAKTTSITVNSFLPSGVTAMLDNSAFVVTASPSSTAIARQLGQDCAACAGANGSTVPKPAFTSQGTSGIAVPGNVMSATLLRDTLTVAITNGYNFDPIRPSAAARGYLIISVKSGAVTVGRDSLDGSSTSLAAGSVTQRKIPLSGTMNGASGLQISTTLNSPLGDPATIDASRLFTVAASSGPLFVSNAMVNLASQTVTAAPSDLDLSNIDSTISKHADSGALLLTVDNPFGATGNLTVNFVGAASPISKVVPLVAGKSSPSVT